MHISKLNQNQLLMAVGLLVAFFFYWFNPFHLEPNANKTVAIGVLMIAWWVTEALPMPVVALLPLLLFPLFKVASIEETSKAYSNPVVFLFMGGFMIGLAIEKWNLHKRIALLIVNRTGTSGNRIILGFIIATGFISMWLSNTATTMMMLPIALSVITVIKNHEQQGQNSMNFAISLMLVIAYASNLGGMATLIGTPPNVAFAGFISKKYGYTIQFLDWMLICTPLVMVLLGLLYIVLTRWLYPSKITQSEHTHRFITTELELLGKLTGSERRVLFVFGATALLWITKDLLNSLNWFKLDDNMIALAGAISLFTIPAAKTDGQPQGMLLHWKDTSKMAWGILLLFGGGIALANTLEKAGVMSMIGNWLAGFGHLGGLTLILVIVIVCIFLSELMSNVAQVIVLAPVLAALADALQLDPLLVGIPMTLAASAASMLPMGTPPNAIAFSSGHVKMKDMMKAGLIMNLISIVLITLFVWLLLPSLMHISNG